MAKVTNILRTGLLALALLPALGDSAAAQVPDWSVNASDFDLSAAMTAVLSKDFEPVEGELNQVAAMVDGEVRGVATPVNVLDSWMFFITIYSDTNGETISFQAYIADDDQVLDVDETIAFQANGTFGDPSNPTSLNAFLEFDFAPTVSGIADQTVEVGDAFATIDLSTHLQSQDDDPITWSFSAPDFSAPELDVTIDGSVATVTPPFAQWTGTDTLLFTAVEDTDDRKSGSDAAVFTVLPLDHAPQVDEIAAQTIGALGAFDTINLDEHVTETDGDDLAWQAHFQAFDNPTDVPDWSVNSADFSLSMTISAQVRSRGTTVADGDYLLGAFVEDENEPFPGEIRGVAAPTEVLGEWVYFLTVFADDNGEEILLYFFDGDTGETLPVQERQEFASNATEGSPGNPVQLDAGYLVVEINGTDATVDIIDSTWTGTETAVFVATDVGSLHGFSDSTTADFTVLPDHAPEVGAIADQTIEVGESFTAFDLDDVLTELDGDAVAWSSSGAQQLDVQIDAADVATVSDPSGAFTGTETITFTATDQTDNGLSGSTEVDFQILPVDHPPLLAQVADQTVGFLGSFDTVDLAALLTEEDGDDILYSHDFPAAGSDAAPSWSVQASDFELSMNVTASVAALGKEKGAGNHVLGALVDGEVRGTASPVQALDGYLYFLAIYADVNDEVVKFRYYDAEAQRELAVLEPVVFQANDVIGSPEDPLELTAGILAVTIADDTATVDIVDSTFTGSETIRFIATDEGTQKAFADSSTATFTVLEDNGPTVSGIADRTIEQGEDFATFDLDDHLQELDGDPILWSVEGDANLTVSIDVSNVVQVSPVLGEFVGTETLTFVATDNTGNGLSDGDEASFSIRAPDNAPEIGTIAAQSIRQFRRFDSFDLDDAVAEQDGDEVAWSFLFPAGQAEAVPDWSVNISDFELTMSVTATVLSRGLEPGDGDHLLAAYVVDDSQPDGIGEIRGVASPVEISGQSQYFLTVYANDTGEQIGFRFYDAAEERTYPVGTTLTFAANATFGDPESPLELQAGFLTFSVDVENVVTVDIVDSTGTGVETIQFAVQDQGTTKSLADTTQVTFTVEESLTIFGDVDGDEEVTAEDAQLILDHVVELDELTGVEATAADVSGDGEISPHDAALVLRHVEGLITTFPVEQ